MKRYLAHTIAISPLLSIKLEIEEILSFILSSIKFQALLILGMILYARYCQIACLTDRFIL